MELWQAILLAIVEGLTEYLPISSTGHIIVTSSFLGINENQFVKDYTVMVQFGAILSVIFLYWRRFLAGRATYTKLFVGFLPAAIIGFAIKGLVDQWLSNVSIVAGAFIVGGFVLIFTDRWLSRSDGNGDRDRVTSFDQLTYRQAAIIGVFQCLAFVPGVSRSAASIFGGLMQKLDRKTAAEFSFLLAVPTLTAAGGYKLLKILPNLESSQITYLLTGNLISFIVGTITIKIFIGFLSRHGFKSFGIYRIVLGALIFWMLASGHSLKMI